MTVRGMVSTSCRSADRPRSPAPRRLSHNPPTGPARWDRTAPRWSERPDPPWRSPLVPRAAPLARHRVLRADRSSSPADGSLEAGRGGRVRAGEQRRTGPWVRPGRGTGENGCHVSVLLGPVPALGPTGPGGPEVPVVHWCQRVGPWKTRRSGRQPRTAQSGSTRSGCPSRPVLLSSPRPARPSTAVMQGGFPAPAEVPTVPTGSRRVDAAGVREVRTLATLSPHLTAAAFGNAEEADRTGARPGRGSPGRRACAAARTRPATG